MASLQRKNTLLAKMLYDQKKYKEAESLLIENIKTSESKYLMGKICLNTNRTEEARDWFEEAIRAQGKWILPRMELAKINLTEGDFKCAKREFEVCLKRESQNGVLKSTVAKYYVQMGENEEAEKLVIKALNLDPDNEKVLKDALLVYDNLQDYKKMYRISEKLNKDYDVKSDEYKVLECMARTYFNLGKYDKVIEVFKGKTDDRITKTISGLYKQRIYTALYKDKQEAKIYQEILDDLEPLYSEEARLKHIQKHTQNDLTKKIHGVFTMDLGEVLDRVKTADKIKQKGNGCDLYCIQMDGCGYEGGSQGDGHILNYVTLLTLPDIQKPVTLFPSDKIQTISRLQDKKDEER